MVPHSNREGSTFPLKFLKEDQRQATGMWEKAWNKGTWWY